MTFACSPQTKIVMARLDRATQPRRVRGANRVFWRADARLMDPLPSLCYAKLAGNDTLALQ
jgi:hypothetical protein